MKTLVTNQRITLSILVITVLLCGLGGVSYAADPPAAELQVETEQALTETNLDRHNVTLKLIGGTWTNSVESIKNSLTVTGIEGVNVREGYNEKYQIIDSWCDQWFCYTNWPRTLTRWVELVRRVGDNTVKIQLAFEGDFEVDTTLIFTVEADAIENYDGPALTAEVPVTAYKGVIVSVTSPLTETTLDGSVTTLTLTGGVIYEADVAKIRDAVTVTGIDGVTADTSKIQRLSDTKINVPLAFDGIDFDIDTALIFNVETRAIVNYTGDTFTTEVPVTAMKESVATSVVSPLTEATLNENPVTLTLIGETYDADVAKIRDAVTVTGIDGVTADTSKIQRLSDTKINVPLIFDGTDFDTDATLTFSVDKGAIAGDTKDTLTTKVPVTAIEESVAASVVSQLTEATLDESIVTLTLTGLIYESDVSKIRDAVTVSGITGVTVVPTTVQRLSDTEINVELDFDWTNFDTDATLTFNVGSGAIAAYTGDTFTAEIPVTAIEGRVEISVSASVVSPLTEATLSEGTVTLTLMGGIIYETDISKIRDAVTVSGITGLTVNTSQVQRLSDRKVTLELGFDGTDFDTNATLTFSVAAGAIANYTGDAFTTEISVTAYKESLSASVVSPLTEATLDAGTVTLTLTGATYEADLSKISSAVTVSGITGVTVNTSKVQRLSDRRVTVALAFDGTDFDTDTTLTFSVIADAITNYKGATLTTEVIVTPGREEQVSIFWQDGSSIRKADIDGSNVQTLVGGLSSLQGIALDVEGGKIYWTIYGSYHWQPKKIQRANLDGSNIEDLITGGLDNPNSIALDVEGGKMYWTDGSKIQRANLDGSNIEDLITGGLDNPNSIALDVEGGKMYWTDGSKIQRANLDGSNIEDLITGGLDNPNSIALDVEGGKMYWTDENKIQRANLDGSNIEDLITGGLDNPNSIALDVEGGKMYWTDTRNYHWQPDKIQRANLDGSNIEDLITEGLGNPWDITVGITSRSAPTTAKEDVNRDGVVDVQDLVIVAQRYGHTGMDVADINGDKVVNVDDFILVAAAVDAAAAAAPAARAQVHSHFTAAQLQGWLTEARASRNSSYTYRRGIAVLEQLLALVAPEATALLANYPNPFNPETWIPYQLSEPADVSLTIYDIQGRVVRALDLGHQRAGIYHNRSRAAYWDGRNAVGEPVASGVYFYTLSAGNFTATRKMLIRK